MLMHVISLILILYFERRFLSWTQTWRGKRCYDIRRRRQGAGRGWVGRSEP